MGDISTKITRKSLKAKKKAAIKTIKAQAREKIHEVKIEYATNPNLKKAKDLEKQQKKALRQQKKNARIAYNEHQPRVYSLGEDLFNSISHGIGTGLSAAAITLLVIKAALRTPAGQSTGLYVTSFALFGAALFVLYLMSTLYHAIPPYSARRVFSVMDRIAIYILIAGTYAPFVLTQFASPLKWVAFIVVSSICLILSVLYAIFRERIKKFSEFTYIALGWILILTFTCSPAGSALNTFSKSMFIAGGVSYSVGVIFYLMRNHKWAHCIFHVFVLGGSILHFFSVYAII